MTRFALTAKSVFMAGRLVEDLAVLVEDGRIADLTPPKELPPDVPLRDLGAGILAPGFVDAQVNGGGGVLLNETPTVDGVRAIAAAHRRFGTTGLLPTVITDAPEVMQAAVAAVSEAIRQAVPGVLGIHIEGPFIDPARKGAHDPRFVRTPTDVDIDWLCGLDCGRVLVTLAPNMVELSAIEKLSKAGVIVSLGHSDATAGQALAAIKAGATGFTHLFNAMSQLSGRAPGMVGAALLSEAVFCGLIADGFHVDPQAIAIALSAKRGARLFLVSDAMPSAAGGPARFALQGRPVEAVGGRLQLADGTLAGANITMLDALRVIRSEVELPEAINMATAYPATFLGLHGKFGRIAPRYQASLVHLDDELNVLETWIDGQSS